MYLISLEVYGGKKNGGKYRVVDFFNLCRIYYKVLCEVDILRIIDCN